jgi:hypothetical protein
MFLLPASLSPGITIAYYQAELKNADTGLG